MGRWWKVIGCLWVASLSLTAAATLTLTFTNNGEPLPDPTQGRFYVYEPGERENYLAWGHGAKSVRVPDGAYDLVIRYTNDLAEREIVREEVELSGDVEEEIDFQVPLATLTVDVTSGGQPIDPFTARFSLYPTGRRDKPIVSRRPGSSVTLRPGTYDVEVTVRDLRGVKSTWVEQLPVVGEVHRTVEVGAPPARLHVTLLRQGVPLTEREGIWRIYRPGIRETPLAEGRSGQAADLEPGTYDLGIFFRDGAGLGERWIENLKLSGEVYRQIDVARPPARLRVDVQVNGAPVSDAWYVVHAAGDRRAPLASAASGQAIEVEPGTYDIGCFLVDGGLRAERWLEGQRITEDSSLDVDLEPASVTLRVLPPRHSAGSLQSRAELLLILDSSAQMAEAWDGKTRMDWTVREIRDALREARRSRLQVGLRAFGIAPLAQQDCRDTSLLAPISSIDSRRLFTTLELLRPAGLSPMAMALDEATGDLSEDDWNTIVLVTGSASGCGEDPCVAASRLVRRGLAERIHVVGLNLEPGAAQSLGCVGEFESVRDRRGLETTLRRIFRSAEEPELGTVAVFTPGWEEWRATAAIGERLELSPGTYDVLIRYGGQTYAWERVDLERDLESVVGPRPAPR